MAVIPGKSKILTVHLFSFQHGHFPPQPEFVRLVLLHPLSKLAKRLTLWLSSFSELFNHYHVFLLVAASVGGVAGAKSQSWSSFHFGQAPVAVFLRFFSH